MDIQENAFTEALLNEIEDGASRDIDDAWEYFLNQASCHFRPELMDCGAVEIEDFEEYENDYPQPDEDDVLPF